MDTRFAASDRTSLLEELSEQTWDVLVIGGGITGAGIALDAQSRGMKTALIEMQDFAAGTSSRSTKLVHGGLRYLKQFEVKVVAEVGRERAVVYENGPHITTPEWMLLPIYKGGTFGKLSTSIGLAVYDRLAGVRLRERRRMLGVEAALAKEPLLKKKGLKGGGYYVEYRTDDARLTIEVMKKAAELGAKAVNYVKAEELLYEDGRICGVAAADLVGGGSYTIKARHVVNATGPWVDGIREMDGSRQGKTLRLTKGIHLVFDGSRFPLRQAVYFDTPDGRMMFAIPRDGKTYVGTTDTDYEGDAAAPKMTEGDRKYVVDAAAAMFPALGLSEADVESSWAGLRPLIYEEGKSPSEVSRRDEVFRSDSGLLTIAGGKLTGYRRMAETVTDRLSAELGREYGRRYPKCRTKDIPLSGGDVGGSDGLSGYIKQAETMGRMQGLSPAASQLIASRYGSNAGTVYALLPASGARPQAMRFGGASQLPPEIHAALLYAIRHEMAVKPADFLIRRTGALFFDRKHALEWKDLVAAVMAQELRYGEEQMSRFKEELERELQDAVDAQPDSAGRAE